MDENEEQSLDLEYRRYLEIMRPYLQQLLDPDVIDIINAWIQRLCCCKQNEKVQRNKYIFAMCYQLSKGILDEPFTHNPTTDELAPLQECTLTDYSFNDSSEIDVIPKFPNNEVGNEIYNDENEYENRATKLIMKLREIKNQNFMFQNELMALKTASTLRHEHTVKPQDNFMKVHNATSVHFRFQESNTTLNRLKSKLQEVQDSRKSLIETINDLQDKLDNINEMKRHEIEDLHAQHRLQIIQVKTSLREELKANHDKNIHQLRQQHEKLIKDIESKHSDEKENLAAHTEAMIAEKDKIIQSMETEIINLKNNIDGLKSNQYLILSNFIDNQNIDFNSKCVTQKAKELEKRLNKMEKSKVKYSKAYEAKLANLQKEKHLAECSLQLQLMKQRTQIIHESTDEHETELATALDKLENKYKDIVASVQATAVQRRIQDQVALESIIQTVCGIKNEGLFNNLAQRTHTDHLSSNAIRTQTRDTNRSCDTELPTIIRDNKVGSIIVGNKTYADENVINDYCTDGENFNELFERVHVPQRDTGGSSLKK
ncbi:uncharacterized protein LOC112054670 [Bicyclus anynana]|uniref:Uncharacterized protein LOC112054670 n=1 Tax=Bicyclus anynana TaxID=110368 RepID=A0ABM3LG17_BICAN|nr:uncharacterized protein LOC112054670 [Bicyclus anynana]